MEAKEETRVQVVSDSEKVSEDVLINKLGYEQKYRRVLKTFGNIAVGIACTSPMFGVMVTSFYPLAYGGYWGLTWGWIIPAILFVPQALAVAELCSSMPTNGAFYWWTAALAPPKHSRSLSFISGWIIFVQNVSVVASVAFAVGSTYAVLISAIHPEWAPTNPQKMALAMAMIIIWTLINLAQMEKLSILFQAIAISIICATVVYVIGVPAMHAAKGFPFTSGHTLFTEYTNFSDWTRAVSVPTTFFAVAFATNGFQVPAMIVEETQNARVAAPKAIVTSYLTAAVVGFAICLIAAICIVDIGAAASDPTGFPLYTMVLTNFGQTGGFVFLMISITFAAISGSSIMFAYSSQLAAFSRDGGIPFPKTFAYVHSRTNMPIPSMLLICSLSFLLLLFSLSSIAGSILYSLAIITTYLTNCLPIGLRVFSGDRFVQGPFNYGKFSWPIHAWALLTEVYIVIMASFPSSPHWTKETFNYNWCVALGSVLFATSLWFAYGRQHYQGVNIDALQDFQAHVKHEKEEK